MSWVVLYILAMFSTLKSCDLEHSGREKLVVPIGPCDMWTCFYLCLIIMSGVGEKSIYHILLYQLWLQSLCAYCVQVYMCVHMCVHACGSQRTLSSVITWAQFILFLRWGLSLTWNFTSWLDCLASKSQGPICLGFPVAGIASTHLPGCFAWVLGIYNSICKWICVNP